MPVYPLNNCDSDAMAGFMIDEISKIRQDILKIEDRITEFELGRSVPFDAADIRYSRLLEEKKILLTHLCELRLQFIATKSASVNNELCGSKRARSDSPPPFQSKASNSDAHPEGTCHE